MSVKFQYTPSAYKASKTYTAIPNVDAADFSFSRASIATRINEDGFIESVGDNVPRMDYTDGGCPVLLTEPQAENLIEYSEDFSQWVNFGVSLSLNNLTNPKGESGIYSLTESNSDEQHKTQSNGFNVSAGSEYTFSFFVKNKGINKITVASFNFGDLEINSTYNLENETSTSTAGESTIKKIGDYYLCTATGLCNLTRSQGISIHLNRTDISFPFSYQGDGTSGAYIWGAQLETGDKATSYIPTNGATVVRLADTGIETGDISQYIDSSKGSIEIEVKSESQNNSIISLTDNSYVNRIYFQFKPNDAVNLDIRFNGNTLTSTIDLSVYNKIRGEWNEDSASFFIEDVLIGSTSFTPFANNSLKLLKTALHEGSNPFFGEIKSIKIS